MFTKSAPFYDVLYHFVDYEAERHLRIAAGADTAEAFRAFVAKRKPNFGSGPPGPR